eukprot:6214008-Pleurochrysis_carterae.AAC.5
MHEDQSKLEHSRAARGEPTRTVKPLPLGSGFGSSGREAEVPMVVAAARISTALHAWLASRGAARPSWRLKAYAN